jgi:copper transporter 1
MMGGASDSDMTYDNGHVGHGNGAMDHSMMKMYFHFSQHAVILFESWSTHSWQGMLGSCIAVFIMAALYEGLKVLREFLLRRSNVMVRYNTMPVPTNDDVHVTETHKSVGGKMLSWPHLLQTLLHILQVTVSYFLMLIFMTYNVWLCIAVGLGAGAGYFAFSWRRAIVVDINEHCH